MRLLLDTHILLWAAGTQAPGKAGLSPVATRMIDDPDNILHFSAPSIWEVAIKAAPLRADVDADAHLLRRGLLDNGYVETPIKSAHAAAVSQLPPIHKDPFDRLLVAQAAIEGMTLLTADHKVAAYPGPIRRV